MRGTTYYDILYQVGVGDCSHMHKRASTDDEACNYRQAGSASSERWRKGSAATVSRPRKSGTCKDIVSKIARP